MIPKEVYNYNKEELSNWIINEAGSSNCDYFGAKKAGGLKLQQNGHEYSELLLFLKSQKIESYLGLGIGNGGSFALECFFMKETLNCAIAVDCLAYKNLNIGQCEEEVLEFMKQIGSFRTVQIALNREVPRIYNRFVNETTDKFFETLDAGASFDCIFIDAGHSYEDAKKDYDNSLQKVNKGGFIIFHDIASVACPGIIRLWKEAKANHSKSWEFIHGSNCGIGIVQV